MLFANRLYLKKQKKKFLLFKYNKRLYSYLVITPNITHKLTRKTQLNIIKRFYPLGAPKNKPPGKTVEKIVSVATENKTNTIPPQNPTVAIKKKDLSDIHPKENNSSVPLKNYDSKKIDTYVPSSIKDNVSLQNQMHSKIGQPTPVSETFKENFQLPDITKLGEKEDTSSFKEPLNSSTSDHEIKGVERNTELEKKSLDAGVLEYANAGSQDQNGSPRLTKYGHDINRIIDTRNKVIRRDPTDVVDEYLNSELKREFFVATLTVNEETTSILHPIQSHPGVIVEKTLSPENNSTYTACAMLTSEGGTKIGLNGFAGPRKVQLSEINIDGQTKPQYVVPIIPPQTVTVDQFNQDDQGTAFINQKNILSTIEILEESAAEFHSVPYNETGITAEKLDYIVETAHVLVKENPKTNPVFKTTISEQIE